MDTAAVVRPTRPRPQIRTFIVAIGLIAFTIFAGRKVGFTITTVINLGNLPDNPFVDTIWDKGKIWSLFWPIPWDWVFNRQNVIDPLLETFQIAIVSSLIGCSLALPISFAMSRLTTPNWPIYILSKVAMNVIRAVPDLFWAKLLVVAIGIGAFAGAWALSIFSLAVMVKLFSETIDGADPRPLEAARAAGGRHIPAVRTGVLPTVFPAYVAYALYVFELNIRASLVIGLVGAGGIGRVIETQRQVFQFDRVLGILILIFCVVFVIEQISVAIRKRLV